MSLTDADDGSDDAKALSLATAALSGLYFHCDEQFVHKAVKLCVDVWVNIHDDLLIGFVFYWTLLLISSS